MRVDRLYIALHFLAVGLIAPASAEPSPETIDGGQRWTLTSEVLGEERVVLVSTPPGYGRDEARSPVLYLTDGQAHFEHTAATVDFLASVGRIPEMIVVGIPNTDRNRDLTPTSSGLPRPDGTVGRFPTSGGADVFLDFLADELMPFIESRYRTQPFRVLAGHSLGGLFALHTMLERPDLFGATIAVSPALPWDDELIRRQFEKRAPQGDPWSATLILAVGDEPRLQDSYNRLVELLEATELPDLDWVSHHFPGEDHRSVVLRAHDFGLREIFAGWRMPRDEHTGAVAGGFDALLEHHAQLSTRFGYEILPPEGQVERLGHQAMQRGELDAALVIFRHNVDYHPKSVRAHGKLGRALERAGALSEALAIYRVAAALATTTGSPGSAEFEDDVRRLEEALAAETSISEEP